MGYEFTTIREAKSAMRHAALYATLGLCIAQTAGQKQFILECIARELGMGIATLRQPPFEAEPGEPFDVSGFLDEFERREALRGL